MQVLEAYTEGFDFAHIPFDSALRMFLESFKLPGRLLRLLSCVKGSASERHIPNLAADVTRVFPCAARAGEAQKIDRIINAFGRHYYSANEETFRCADAAYVLAYSVIMLNTDQHNSQVRVGPSWHCQQRGFIVIIRMASVCAMVTVVVVFARRSRTR